MLLEYNFECLKYITDAKQFLKTIACFQRSVQLPLQAPQNLGLQFLYHFFSVPDA